jgi:hypothetical protein
VVLDCHAVQHLTRTHKHAHTNRLTDPLVRRERAAARVRQGLLCQPRIELEQWNERCCHSRQQAGQVQAAQPAQQPESEVWRVCVCGGGGTNVNWLVAVCCVHLGGDAAAGWQVLVPAYSTAAQEGWLSPAWRRSKRTHTQQHTHRTRTCPAGCCV